MTHDNDGQHEALDPALDARVTDALNQLGTVDPPPEFVGQVMWRTRQRQVRETTGRPERRNTQGATMAKKVLVGLAGVAAVGLAVAYMTGFPPALYTEGTIGAAQRYQAEQISNNDVKVGDQALQTFLQSDLFDKLAHDKKAMAVLASPAFEALLANAGLRASLASDAFRDQLASPAVHEALASPAIAEVLASPAFAQALASPALSKALDAQAIEAALASPQIAEVLANVRLHDQLVRADLVKTLASPELRGALASPAFQAALASPALRDALASSALAEALASPAFEALLASPQMTEQLAMQGAMSEVLQAAAARTRE